MASSQPQQTHPIDALLYDLVNQQIADIPGTREKILTLCRVHQMEFSEQELTSWGFIS